MKSQITVEIPLSGGDDTFNLPEPCTCCGAPVHAGAVPWERKISYNLVKYRWNSKGDIILSNLVINGEAQLGSVTLQVPYCASHQKNVKLFKYLSAVIVTILLLAAFVVPIFADLQDTSFTGGSIIDGFVPMLGFLALAYFVAIVVIKLISSMILLFRPDLKDYPTRGIGHWGLSVQDVRHQIAGPGADHCVYFLPVAFANRESAQRFISSCPQVRIIKGMPKK